MYESSDSQFFTTATGIQSGPEAFDKSGYLWPFYPTCELQKYYAVSD